MTLRTKKQLGTYVYFALTGDDFDPHDVTRRLEIQPTESWKKGDKGQYKPVLNFSKWEIATGVDMENLDIGKLILELVDKLFEKIEAINELKKAHQLNSVLEVVLYGNTNEEESTPALYFDLKTIEFLYKTGSKSDVDIYRFSS